MSRRSGQKRARARVDLPKLDARGHLSPEGRAALASERARRRYEALRRSGDGSVRHTVYLPTALSVELKRRSKREGKSLSRLVAEMVVAGLEK